MIKAAFFDIDGTLVSFATHTVPPSARRALTAMRARGIKTVIASGRSRGELQPEVRSGLDAYITMNGQLCYDDAGIYRSAPIPPADVAAIVELVHTGALDVLVLQEGRTFVSGHSPAVCAVERHVNLSYTEGPIDDALAAPVYQFCAFVPASEEHLILDVTQAVATTRWTDLFCDVVPAAGGKDYGVRATLERYGLAPEEAIAFGDGENDLAMFDAVGTSVAMGNAWDLVKARATYVTDAVDDDGIWNACVRFGLV